MGLIGKMKTKLHVGKSDGARSAEKRTPPKPSDPDRVPQPRSLDANMSNAMPAGGKPANGLGPSLPEAHKAPKAQLVMEGVPAGPDGKQPALGAHPKHLLPPSSQSS